MVGTQRLRNEAGVKQVQGSASHSFSVLVFLSLSIAKLFPRDPPSAASQFNSGHFRPLLPAKMDATTAPSRFDTNNSVTSKKQPRSQLSKAMEHMRFAVTVDPIPKRPSDTPTAPLPTSSPTPTTTAEPESDAYGVPASYAPLRKPPHRSHSPTNNQKRTDPFAFGSRYLEEGDDIFEFNAWDHVETDPAYLAFSEEQYSRQRLDPVSDYDKQRFNSNPEKWWNLFYKNNKSNFFKNRKWLAQEFPVLDEVTKEDAGEVRLLEVGAGAGNSAFPILQKNENERLRMHACDFSRKAVDLIRENELYNPRFIQADVWDVASSPDSENAGLPPGIEEGSVDVVLMVFIFSALEPKQWSQAVRNIWRVLKPGGQVLFRDYGKGDLAQVRFKKGRYMEENFYVRGDGTRVYFFERQELEGIWGGRWRTETVEGNNDDEDGRQRESSEPDEESLRVSPGQEMTNPPTPAFEIVHFGTQNVSLLDASSVPQAWVWEWGTNKYNTAGEGNPRRIRTEGMNRIVIFGIESAFPQI
ncbi:S-adenosyl-L-methionine-dependent methyltransferase [Lindgomyces ingoldianus]|uniref:S-adenosyl-L-methionine-dependent methyltransferase n=1 Tax=Lindgomyces ingoldianus TaxID=673940 RepID=A0ACB6R8T3_9PLEO|nr:S-adenosyl-L-methionine-dependent methyltransferase [Lindgomyces ingoldianus]KAF2474740.1 S-adenosyl-L-methionine-dependent methyltransferase [Lindgomyces ingoldianus]